MHQIQDIFAGIIEGRAGTVAESVKMNNYLSNVPYIQLYNSYLNYLIIGSKKDIYSMFNKTDKLAPLMMMIEKLGGVYCKLVFNADEKLVYRHMICIYTQSIGKCIFTWGGLFDGEIQPEVLDYILCNASDDALKELLRFVQFNCEVDLQGDLIRDLPIALNAMNDNLECDIIHDVSRDHVVFYDFCEIPRFLEYLDKYGD